MGTVINQEITIFLTFIHLTALILSAAPTPITDVLTIWLDETGTPRAFAVSNDVAEAS